MNFVNVRRKLSQVRGSKIDRPAPLSMRCLEASDASLIYTRFLTLALHKVLFVEVDIWTETVLIVLSYHLY